LRDLRGIGGVVDVSVMNRDAATDGVVPPVLSVREIALPCLDLHSSTVDRAGSHVVFSSEDGVPGNAVAMVATIDCVMRAVLGVREDAVLIAIGIGIAPEVNGPLGHRLLPLLIVLIIVRLGVVVGILVVLPTSLGGRSVGISLIIILELSLKLARGLARMLALGEGRKGKQSKKENRFHEKKKIPPQ